MCGEGPVEKCSLFDDDPEYDPSVWDSDDDSCYGEGDPPDMLLFLHQNRHAYRRQDALDAAIGIELHVGLDRIKVNRAPRFAGRKQHAENFFQMAQRLG